MNYVSSNQGLSGISLQGYIVASYREMVALFGEPHPNCTDGYKVSTSWNLQNEVGDLINLYDYKMTNLYDDCKTTVEEFRSLPEYEWHIGALTREIGDKFHTWIQRRLNKLRKGLPLD